MPAESIAMHHANSPSIAHRAPLADLATSQQANPPPPANLTTAQQANPTLHAALTQLLDAQRDTQLDGASLQSLAREVCNGDRDAAIDVLIHFAARQDRLGVQAQTVLRDLYADPKKHAKPESLGAHLVADIRTRLEEAALTQATTPVSNNDASASATVLSLAARCQSDSADAKNQVKSRLMALCGPDAADPNRTVTQDELRRAGDQITPLRVKGQLALDLNNPANFASTLERLTNFHGPGCQAGWVHASGDESGEHWMAVIAQKDDQGQLHLHVLDTNGRNAAGSTAVENRLTELLSSSDVIESPGATLHFHASPMQTSGDNACGPLGHRLMQHIARAMQDDTPSGLANNPAAMREFIAQHAADWCNLEAPDRDCAIASVRAELLTRMPTAGDEPTLGLAPSASSQDIARQEEADLRQAIEASLADKPAIENEKSLLADITDLQAQIAAEKAKLASLKAIRAFPEKLKNDPAVRNAMTTAQQLNIRHEKGQYRTVLHDWLTCVNEEDRANDPKTSPEVRTGAKNLTEQLRKSFPPGVSELDHAASEVRVAAEAFALHYQTLEHAGEASNRLVRKLNQVSPGQFIPVVLTKCCGCISESAADAKKGKVANSGMRIAELGFLEQRVKLTIEAINELQKFIDAPPQRSFLRRSRTPDPMQAKVKQDAQKVLDAMKKLLTVMLDPSGIYQSLCGMAQTAKQDPEATFAMMHALISKPSTEATP